jgi:hypothetical protein
MSTDNNSNINDEKIFKNKYLKYKIKYLEMKKEIEELYGGKKFNFKSIKKVAKKHGKKLAKEIKSQGKDIALAGISEYATTGSVKGSIKASKQSAKDATKASINNKKEKAFNKISKYTDNEEDEEESDNNGGENEEGDYDEEGDYTEEGESEDYEEDA